MAEPLERAWTLDEFFAWQGRQPDRYEDGLAHASPQLAPEVRKEQRDSSARMEVNQKRWRRGSAVSGWYQPRPRPPRRLKY